MAEEFWKSFISQAPGIAGILAAIVLFLKYGIAPLLKFLSEAEQRRAQQDLLWQTFLSEQREQTAITIKAFSDQVSGALSRIAAEVNSQNEAIRELAKDLAVHTVSVNKEVAKRKKNA